MVEGLAAKDCSIKKEHLLAAVRLNNSTIAKLMLTLNHNVQEFIDIKTNKKDAKRIKKLIQNSMGFLSSSVQLNIVSYTALEEKDSLLATLFNYQSFIEQTLLTASDSQGKSVAWLVDNFQKGNESTFAELAGSIANKISLLVDNTHIDKLEENKNERIKKKDLQNSKM